MTLTDVTMVCDLQILLFFVFLFNVVFCVVVVSVFTVIRFLQLLDIINV